MYISQKNNDKTKPPDFPVASVGPLRGGNKPPVLLGVRNERSKNKNGELKASRKDLKRRKTSEYNSKWFGDRITKDTRRKFTMKFKNNEIKSSAHSKYRCQYHIVFSTLF